MTGAERHLRKIGQYQQNFMAEVLEFVEFTCAGRESTAVYALATRSFEHNNHVTEDVHFSTSPFIAQTAIL
jgi:hypothetical protein